MSKILISAVILTMLFSYTVSGADLYQFEIENWNALKAEATSCGKFFGYFEGKPLMELDSEKSAELRNLGINLSLVAQDFDTKNIYTVCPLEHGPIEFPAGIKTLLSGERCYLAELSKWDMAILGQSGFEVTPLEEMKMPLFFSSATSQSTWLSSYPSDTLADLISQDSLYSYVHRLESFGSRWTYSDSMIAAGNWIRSKFIEFGYDSVWMDPLIHAGHQVYNIAAYKRGTTEPEKVVVIGGHYDAGNNDSSVIMTCTPGADDNGSGTAAVLELARVFGSIECKKSLIFAAFQAEEAVPVVFGSAHMANDLFQQGVDVFFMLNHDMIGFTIGPVDSISLAFPTRASKLFEDALLRLTDIVPVRGYFSVSDDDPFYALNYSTMGIIEVGYSHNNPHYHKSSDSAVYLDFSYMSKIVGASAACLGVIINGPSPVQLAIYDGGDGQSLRVNILNYEPTSNYSVFYSLNSGLPFWNYPDTIMLPAMTASCTVTGLTEGQNYCISAMVEDQYGANAPWCLEQWFVPLSTPRIPEALTAQPDTSHIKLFWKPGIELDINHYRLLRKDTTADWIILADDIVDTSYIDYAVEAHRNYHYRLQTVDNDLNLSDSSNEVSSILTTFDWPLLFAEETGIGGLNPDANAQRQYYDSIMNALEFDKYYIDHPSDSLTRGQAGQYMGTIYIDDDNLSHLLSSSVTAVDWYLEFPTDMFLAGWKTVYSVTGSSYLYPGNFFYDHFGLSRVMLSPTSNFGGVNALNGWPALGTEE